MQANTNQIPQVQELHESALRAVRRYLNAEADLLRILQKIDHLRAYLKLGYPSLFQYAVQGLNLSEGTAYNFINVARKAVQIPALQHEICAGSLSVSKARKIVPVLTLENQAEWIAKAKSLSQRQLEKEVAIAAPQTDPGERAIYMSENRMKLTMGVEESLMEKLRRVQDLESQRRKEATSLEDALLVMADLYLKKNDPIEKAKRAQEKTPGETQNDDHQPVAQSDDLQPVARQAELRGTAIKKQAIPARSRHSVLLRDQASCAYIDSRGRRCGQKRWFDIHHITQRSAGGSHSPENLITLCGAHHKLAHQSAHSRTASMNQSARS